MRSLPDCVEGVGDCPELLGGLLWKRPDRSLGLEELEDMLDQYQREVSRNNSNDIEKKSFFIYTRFQHLLVTRPL